MTSSAPRPARSARAAYYLAQAHPGRALVCDKATSGAPSYQPRSNSATRRSSPPPSHSLGERPPAELAKARIRLVIESVFSNLKGQMRLEHHLAKTLPGLAERVAQRLLALTLGILLQPARRSPPESARRLRRPRNPHQPSSEAL